ncbi:GMC family oxidoreductase [Microbulbifer agarilyticus]
MYDYVIIGGGSAGGVLAYRLSENPANKVCLVEAGSGDSSVLVSVPGALGAHMFYHKYNWAYNSQPDAGTNEKGHFCPRGKGLGGSSSINGMVYTRGHSSDYDRWSALGNVGWDFASVLPYFKKSERYSEGESRYHGGSGLLPVKKLKRGFYAIDQKFISAAKQAGLPFNDDFNDNTLEGVGYFQFNIVNGQRAGVARQFIRPAMQRKNLTVITGARVSKVLLEGKRAVGVRYLKEGGEHEIKAVKEVIVSGGALNSPQVLQLSGIGDREELSRVGVECHHHLPGVGKNLQEHPEIALVYRSKKKDGFSLSAIHRRIWEWLQYGIFRSGANANSILSVGGYFKSIDTLDVPDVQIHFGALMFADHGRNIDYLLDHGFSIHLNVARPVSRGSVSLRNASPLSDPKIELNLLGEHEDLQVLKRAVSKMRKIISQPAMDSHRGIEVSPGADIESDSALEAYIREHASHVYHPAGTCKMGNDPMAVVDHELRVRGIDALRVVDASIMPTLVTANTNAPTIMIAEKAADMILSMENSV